MRRVVAMLSIGLCGCSFINNWGEFRDIDAPDSAVTVDANVRTDGGDPGDSGGPRDGGGPFDAGPRIDGGRIDAGEPAYCSVPLRFLPPRAMLMLDASASMEDVLMDGQQRFGAMRAAVGGIIPRYEARVDLGLIMQRGGSPGEPACMNPTFLSPALNQAATITMILSGQVPNSSSGGGLTLEFIRTTVTPAPVAIFNIMDSAPNSDCGGGGMSPVNYYFNELTAATSAGVTVWHLMLASLSASEGANIQAITGHAAMNISGRAVLDTALTGLFDSLPCTYAPSVPLDPDLACTDGRLLAPDGSTLPCGAEWVLSDSMTVEVTARCPEILDSTETHPTLEWRCDAL